MVPAAASKLRTVPRSLPASHRRPYPARTHVRRDGTPQPGAASGRRAPGRSAAGGRGGRLGQDVDARLPGREPGRSRHPARADPAADVHAPSRPSDALSRRAADRRPCARPGLGRHVPRDRQPAAAAARRGARPVPRLHGPGSNGYRRPDGPDPGRAGVRPGRAAVPAQGHARRRLLAHGERPHQARRGARARVPVVRGGGRAHPHDLRTLYRAQARAERARLRRPAPVLGRALPPPGRRPRDLGAVRPHPGRRVPGHEPAPGRHPRVAPPRRRRPDGRGRRRPGDLRVPERDRRQHPRVPVAVPRDDDREARTQLPVDAPDPRGDERGDRAQPAASREDPVDRTLGWPPPLAAHLHRRTRPGGRRLPVDPGPPRTRHPAARTGGAVPRRPPQRRARGRAHAAQHPLREVRRAEVPRVGARQGRARGAPDRGQPSRRGVVVPRAPAARPRRPGRRATRDGGDRRLRAGRPDDAVPRAGDRGPGARRARSSRACGRRSGTSPSRAPRRPRRSNASAGSSSPCSAAATTSPSPACATSSSSSSSRPGSRAGRGS